MGYCTTFTLEIKKHSGAPVTDGELVAELINLLAKDSEGASYALDADGSSGSDCKWYEWETDLRAFSKKHALFLFVLSGEGEESGDIWKAYFTGGKCQIEKAKIQCDPYDPKKLK